MHAEIVRLTAYEADLKIVSGERMHVLQWRRRLLHDEVLLDGKTQATSYGLFGREKVYGLVFGRDDQGRGGERVMLLIDPRNYEPFSGGMDKIYGVRLETVDGPLIAYGTLDPKSLEKPATFADWMKKQIGMEWGGDSSGKPH
ncbi:MAG: hypothetical protein AAFQ21_07015 [Pseudomonadota bacterium]